LAAADSRDSAAAAEWLTNALSADSFWQHTPDESFYHVILQGCTVSGGLKALAEPAGAIGRSDIIAERPGERYLIIDVKSGKKEGRTESGLKKEPAKASKEALTQIMKDDCAGPTDQGQGRRDRRHFRGRIRPKRRQSRFCDRRPYEKLKPAV
jgi:hypothetical protein